MLLVTVTGDLLVNFGKLCCSCYLVGCRYPVRITRRRMDNRKDSTAHWSKFCVVMFHRGSKIGMYGFRMLSSRLTARSPLLLSIPLSLRCLVMSRSYLCNLLLVKLDLVWCSLCLIVFWP